MIKLTILTMIALTSLACSTAYSETFQVKMENRGPMGKMAFVPSLLHIQPGDSIEFINGTFGHNAMTINYMIPKGAKTFRGAVNEEFTTTLTQNGIYRIVCLPHFNFGMVMLVQVGNDTNLRDYVLPTSLPKYATKRFEKIISHQQENDTDL
ncbi:pseudoazurin [Marinomonas sp. TI.3.20]|uniref:pseudoazurin n=1 Tax=Marinomonas sp. TI.3.20 TaxID=3121296 RepID=UPI00311E2067